MQSHKETINFIKALTPIVLLLLLIMCNLLFMDGDTLSGANQLSLIIASVVAVILSFSNGIKWKTLEKGMIHSVKLATPSIVILFLIGMLGASWLVSGVIPTMIYYGIKIISPSLFLPSTLIITALISITIGSSWSTIATIGIALIGIGNVLGLPAEWTAGAIISGAYFGDKLSPLSDTTNLAASSAGADLMDHIKYMVFTSAPAFIVTMLIFIVYSLFFMGNSSDLSSSTLMGEQLKETFDISLWLLLVPLLMIVLIAKGVASMPTLIISIIISVVLSLLVQRELIDSIIGRLFENGVTHDIGFKEYYVFISNTLTSRTEILTDGSLLSSLLVSGGMGGMLNTVWLILLSMSFGGIMEASGFLHYITSFILKGRKSPLALVGATVTTSLTINTVAGDQYMSIVIPGRMYAKSYTQAGLHPVVLSRTLEDAGTVTSVLIPWNSCGVTQSTILGVATLSYLPFAFFCYLSPIFTLLYAIFKVKIKRINIV